MKKIIAVILAAITMLLCFTSCGKVNTQKIKDKEAVIGILTPGSSDGDEYAEVMKIQEKYGAEKIAVETFDVSLGSSVSSIYEAAQRLLENHNIKAIVFARGVEGTVDAIKNIKAAKPDIECIDVNPAELDYYVSQTADLSISMSEEETCSSMVAAAKKAGMKTVVYFIPDRFKENNSIKKTGEALKAACEDKKLEYVEYLYGDQVDSLDKVKIIMNTAVKECLEEHGEKTAFYSASCVATDAVIQSAAENGAGFIYGSCNCPKHHYQTAFGVDGGENYSQMLENVRAAVDKEVRKNFCVIESSPSPVMMKIALGYAIAYCNGSIDSDGFNEDAFKSSIKTALKDETVEEIEFSVSEKYENIINVGFPVETL